MTEHGHNFIREIAEAYRALEAEQGHLDTIARHEKQRITDGETIARLEIRIMELKEIESSLQAKVRSLEVERDDAGFRFLEAEDRLDAIRNAIGMPEAIANAVAKVKLEQTTPAPIEPEPLHDTGMVGESASPPMTDPVSQIGTVPIEKTSASSEGSSAADPIASTIQDTQSPNAPSTPVESTAASLPEQKYRGKRYHDWAYYVPLSSWLAGGGTEEDYHWRPEANHATVF